MAAVELKWLPCQRSGEIEAKLAGSKAAVEKAQNAIKADETDR